jgi:glutathione synthase/RimK-type ligase-like ATP-grasp enzyme
MRLCFIVEERYRGDSMPLRVAEQLLAWGHEVDLLEPQASITCLTELNGGDRRPYDAWVLKTVSDGPGLTILEAAAAAGVLTINDSRAIRMVRDKAVAAAVAQVNGLPFPMTWFVTERRLLEQIPRAEYPLVVKPSNGSQGRGVRLIRAPEEIDGLDLDEAGDCFLLAQRYEADAGWDVKLYNTGREVYAVERPSPLAGGPGGPDRLIPLTAELRALALQVGRLYGLDIYGIDVVSTPRGWVTVDVNDFPSFRQIPNAAAIVAESILHIAQRAIVKRAAAARSAGGRTLRGRAVGRGGVVA